MGDVALCRQGGEAGDEVGAVRILPEDGPPLDPPHHHMVEAPRSAEAGLAGHGAKIADLAQLANVPYYASTR
jgi:hypothetical protein